MLRRWVEHRLNPLHLFCRFVVYFDLYDAVWHKLFRKNFSAKADWKVLLLVWVRIRDGKTISKKLLERVYRDKKGY